MTQFPARRDDAGRLRIWISRCAGRRSRRGTPTSARARPSRPGSSRARTTSRRRRGGGSRGAGRRGPSPGRAAGGATRSTPPRGRSRGRLQGGAHQSVPTASRNCQFTSMKCIAIHFIKHDCRQTRRQPTFAYGKVWTDYAAGIRNSASRATAPPVSAGLRCGRTGSGCAS